VIGAFFGLPHILGQTSFVGIFMTHHILYYFIMD